MNARFESGGGEDSHECGKGGLDATRFVGRDRLLSDPGLFGELPWVSSARSLAVRMRPAATVGAASYLPIARSYHNGRVVY